MNFIGFFEHNIDNKYYFTDKDNTEVCVISDVDLKLERQGAYMVKTTEKNVDGKDILIHWENRPYLDTEEYEQHWRKIFKAKT